MGRAVSRPPFVIAIADIIVGHLRAAGVGFIFGVPGGGSNLDLIAAAGRAGLPFVLTATETAAALAAIAHAEVTGRPGVCLTTRGPGVTSVVNGVACAWLDRAPLLVFTDGPGRQTNLLGLGIDPQNFEVHLLTKLDNILRFIDSLFRKL